MGFLAKRIERARMTPGLRFHLRPEARFHDGEPVTAQRCWVLPFNISDERGRRPSTRPIMASERR